MLTPSVEQLIYYVVWAVLAYLTYYKCILMYYRYFYYKLQGVPSLGFPLPFIGHLLIMKKARDRVKEYKWTILEEYWKLGF